LAVVRRRPKETRRYSGAVHEQSQELAAFEMAVGHFSAGRLAQAEGIARRLQKKPEVGLRATMLLGKVLIGTGRAPQAVYELERARAQAPDDWEVHFHLHQAYIASRQPDKAVKAGEESFRLSRSEQVAGSLASLLLAEGRFSESERWYDEMRAMNPDNLVAVLGLSRVYTSTLRGRQGLDILQAALKADMRSLGMFRHLGFQMQYVSGVSPQEAFEAHRTAGMLAARQADGYPPRLQVDGDRERKLTIGFLSPDFRQHACAHFLEPLFACHTKEKFRFVAYSNTLYPDEVTQRLKKSVELWRDAVNLPDAVLAQQIADDKVDIAIDLAGHTLGNRLSSLVLRPAPITGTYLGYPATTGVPGIDFRLVDSITDPPGSDAFATEKLVRLDPCFLCFRPLAGAPEVGPLPCRGAGSVTFGSFNILDKVSDATLDAWAEVLKRVPGSRMLIKSKPLREESIAARMRAAFEARGVESSRLELLGWVPGLAEHIGLYRRIDIALDTYPYNGTTTTCEALWMGVPVVTWRGDKHASRVGGSLLTAVGLGELIAEDAASYVQVSAGLASDVDRLSSLRQSLRERMAASPLCDERGFTGRFESMMRELWRAWCASRRAT
jgi:protein O-GlcNAc transferase